MRSRRALIAALVSLLAAAPFAIADDPNCYLPEGTEKVEIKDPAMKVTRPNKDWVFLDLEALAKKDPQSRNVNLKARLLQGGAAANFYVMAWKDEREELTSEKVGQEQLETTRSYFKDKGKLTASGKTKQSKLEAWGFEVEGALASSGAELDVSKVIVYRPADKEVFVLYLEVSKKNAELVKKDKPKLFEGVKLQ